MRIPSRLLHLLHVLTALASMGLLLACASDPPDPQWRKEGGTPDELDAARALCMKQQERRNRQEAVKSAEQELRKYYYNQCMNEQGWYSTAAPGKASDAK
ncbi:MAG: hypothetical protein JRG96_06310 [Deltaproteobacteria bacterium]|nr:hypothetical protein [Deltaproteobacteria bacterium]